MSWKFDGKARIPIRALSYENKDMAIIRELIIDYKDHTVYVKGDDGNIYNISTSPATLNEITKYLKENSEIVTDVIIEDNSGNKVTIGTAFSDIYQEITNNSDDITDLKNTIESLGSYFASKNHKHTADDIENIALKNHTHDYMDIENLEENFAWITHKHKYSDISDLGEILKNYIPISGGELTGGPLIFPNNVQLQGRTAKNADVICMIYIGADNKVHVGHADNPIPIIFDNKIILSPNSYGETEPTTGEEGQLFFKLI